jgi:hypothetical protein
MGFIKASGEGFDILSGSYKYAKYGGMIPSETKTGQLSLLPHGFGKERLPRHSTAIPRSPRTLTPPFIGGHIQPRGNGPASRAVLRSHVTQAARKQEKTQKESVALARLKAKAASDAAIRQQDKMDAAKKAGQITTREIVKQNRILMRRRRNAMGM